MARRVLNAEELQAFGTNLRCGPGVDGQDAYRVFDILIRNYSAASIFNFKISSARIDLVKPKQKKNKTCLWKISIYRVIDDANVNEQYPPAHPDPITVNQAADIINHFKCVRPFAWLFVGTGRYGCVQKGMTLLYEHVDCEHVQDFRLCLTMLPVEGCSEINLRLNEFMASDEEYVEQLLQLLASKNDVFVLLFEYDGVCRKKHDMTIQTAVVAIQKFLKKKIDTDSDTDTDSDADIDFEEPSESLFDGRDYQPNDVATFNGLATSGGDAITGSLEESVSLPDSSNGCKICK